MTYVSCPGLKFSEGRYNSAVGSSFDDNSDFVTLLYSTVTLGYIDKRGHWLHCQCSSSASLS